MHARVGWVPPVACIEVDCLAAMLEFSEYVARRKIYHPRAKNIYIKNMKNCYRLYGLKPT